MERKEKQRKNKNQKIFKKLQILSTLAFSMPRKTTGIHISDC